MNKTLKRYRTNDVAVNEFTVFETAKPRTDSHFRRPNINTRKPIRFAVQTFQTPRPPLGSYAVMTSDPTVLDRSRRIIIIVIRVLGNSEPCRTDGTSNENTVVMFVRRKKSAGHNSYRLSRRFLLLSSRDALPCA